mmetsp:Transcript_12012/g.17868  ORF Transcript_12012/g.17868 Transcript_12012/m.17868 type:complete len:1459 (+) Transcript_12012:70-4446(+)
MFFSRSSTLEEDKLPNNIEEVKKEEEEGKIIKEEEKKVTEQIEEEKIKEEKKDEQEEKKKEQEEKKEEEETEETTKEKTEEPKKEKTNGEKKKVNMVVVKDDEIDDDDNVSVTSNSSRLSTSSKATRRSTTRRSRSGRRRGKRRVFDNLYQDDAHRLVVGLCNLSTTKLKADPDSKVELRSRILGLQLIQSILEVNKPVLHAHPDFFMTIKTPICISVLANCCSTRLSLFHLSSSIFKLLFLHYKEYTKTELGAFLNTAFLRILESENSNFKFKEIVIELLDHIVSDPKTIVDLFVNFDCSLTFMNIYERIIEDLCNTTTQSLAEANWMTVKQEERLKDTAMTALVRTLISLRTWMQMHTTKAENEEVVEKLDFERHWKQKNGLKDGMEAFDKSFKKGLALFTQYGVIDDKPETIANFLRNEPGLNKTKIGECIGDRHMTEVREAFTKTFEFEGKTFMEALRMFMAAFRIPGEGQMIDRIVQSFALRYYAQNSDHKGFKDGESAYVLAYSVIMLHTELHSPAFGFRERMTFDQFVINNEGLNDGEDFPNDFLREIYDDVKAKEMKLTDAVPNKKEQKKENNEKSNEPNFNSTAEQKKFYFEKENVSIFNETKPVLKKSKNTALEYYEAVDTKHSNAMFEVTWGRFLKALSSRFEDSNDTQVISKVIEGYRAAADISTHFKNMKIGRHFVDSVANFTYLDKLNVYQNKHMQALKLILEYSDRLAGNINEGWKPILSTFSNLEKLQALRPHKAMGEDQQMSDMTPKQQQQAMEREIEIQTSKKILMLANMDEIDRVYDKSVDLNDEAIVHFVSALCHVSDMELKENRSFSLAKLIIVGNSNISRIPVTWMKIWQPMSTHFIDVASKPNRDISMNAIDSIRQLAMKFVKREEQSQFNFQRNFLKPYVTIMQRQELVDMRRLIVDCVEYMVKLEAAHLRSGWQALIKILEVAAHDSSKDIVDSGNKMMQLLFKDYFDNVSENDAFPDAVEALVAYAQNTVDSEIALKAIDNIELAASKLADGNVVDLETEGYAFRGSNDLHVTHWTPIVSGLAMLISARQNLIVRTSASTCMTTVLTNYGKLFDNSMWESFFKRVIAPIFDRVKQTNSINKSSDWLTDTCHRALSNIVDLIVNFYTPDGKSAVNVVIRKLFSLIESFFVKENDRLCVIANACLFSLVNGLISKNAMEPLWGIFTETLKRVLVKIDSSSELSTWVPKKSRFEGVGSASFASSSSSSSSSQQNTSSASSSEAIVASKEEKEDACKIIRNNCQAHLSLHENLESLFKSHSAIIPDNIIIDLSDTLYKNYETIADVNTGNDFFYFLKENNSLVMNELYHCEIRSMKLVLLFHFSLLAHPDRTKAHKNSVEMLHLTLPRLLRGYLREKRMPSLNNPAYIEAFVVPIVFALAQLNKCTDSFFGSLKELLYPQLCDLIAAKHQNIRAELVTIFKRSPTMLQKKEEVEKK